MKLKPPTTDTIFGAFFLLMSLLAAYALSQLIGGCM